MQCNLQNCELGEADELNRTGENSMILVKVQAKLLLLKNKVGVVEKKRLELIKKGGC